MSEEKLAWTDTETTGLNPDQNRIIDLCVFITDPHLNILDEFATKIKLSARDRGAFHPKAMEVNGYRDEDWANAPENSKDIWDRIYTMTKGLVLCGHNVDFDARFLSAEMARVGVKSDFDRRRYDTLKHAMRLKATLGLPNAKLDTAYAALKGPVLPPHSARPDTLKAMWLEYVLSVKCDEQSPPGSGESFLKLITSLSHPQTQSDPIPQSPAA